MALDGVSKSCPCILVSLLGLVQAAESLKLDGQESGAAVSGGRPFGGLDGLLQAAYDARVVRALFGLVLTEIVCPVEIRCLDEARALVDPWRGILGGVGRVKGSARKIEAVLERVVNFLPGEAGVHDGRIEEGESRVDRWKQAALKGLLALLVPQDGFGVILSKI